MPAPVKRIGGRRRKTVAGSEPEAPLLRFGEAPHSASDNDNDDDNADDSKSLAAFHRAYARHYQSAWVSFLRLPDIPPLVHVRIVSNMGKFMSSLKEPVLLADYLIDAFDGALVPGDKDVSLAALTCLFPLLRDYGLDYQGYYKRLYAMVDATLFQSQSRFAFLPLLDASLKSSHLPTVLVAAFAKRLSRIALWSPPAGALFVLPFVFNLLRRFPECIRLIHREVMSLASVGGGGGAKKTSNNNPDDYLNSAKRPRRDEDDAMAALGGDDVLDTARARLERIREASRALAAGSQKASSTSTTRRKMMEDPFNFDEPDPAQSRAMESSLWELRSLERHYHPTVSSLAKSIFSADVLEGRFRKPELPVTDFAQATTGALLEKERRAASAVPAGAAQKAGNRSRSRGATAIALRTTAPTGNAFSDSPMGRLMMA